ncbi:MAG TPA: NAD-dependent epimerase/dehydratase family protein [Bdellovibrionota bacterium]|nr:NAD-dependent epimerase/dehydratase family protein [Bdellovibrionota bacterium]
MKAGERYFIVGGAGFIGSHFADTLLDSDHAAAVTVFDNFSSGREWHLERHRSDPRFKIVRGDVKDLPVLKAAMAGHTTVIHLASNPDIARAVREPAIDFWEGSYLTQNVVEAMRETGTGTILYASGSGVYGELGSLEAQEDHGPLIPVSTYGASKLFGESLIASYCHMFGLKGRAFRFGNVVGPRQTHGVGFDFLRRLSKEPGRLAILGDGKQSKSYIHVYDVVAAVLKAHDSEKLPFQTYNVATGDYITVTEIALAAIRVLGLSPSEVKFEYAGGDRGWKGDVPVVRLNTDRMQSLGWKCQRGCAQAIEDSLRAMLPEIRTGRISL